MYITDQLEMEELMQRNIALNGLQDRVKGIILNWWVPSFPSIRRQLATLALSSNMTSGANRCRKKSFPSGQTRSLPPTVFILNRLSPFSCRRWVTS